MSEAEIIEDVDRVTDSDQQNTPALLPFSFARKFGVLLTLQEDEKKGRKAICRETPNLSVISEVRRVSGKKVFYELVDERERRGGRRRPKCRGRAACRPPRAAPASCRSAPPPATAS
mgnify:CR=1 FL=1